MVQFPLRTFGYHGIIIYNVVVYGPADTLRVHHMGADLQWSVFGYLAATVGQGGYGVVVSGPDQKKALDNLAAHYGWRAWEKCI